MDVSLARLTRAAIFAPALAALLVACNDDPEPEPQLAGEGEACQIDGDCEEGLACRGDVCTSLNVADMGENNANNGDMDMGGENNSTTNNTANNSSVSSEEYYISYVIRKGFGEESGQSYLHILNTKDGVSTRVSEQSSHCEYGCWLSDALDYFVYIRPASGGVNAFDVYATSVDDSFVAQGDGSVIAEGVERAQFLGDKISFLRDDGSGKQAYYLDLGATEEKLIGDLEVKGTARDTQDSWIIDEGAGRAVLFSPTLKSLSIRVNDFGTPITADDQIYVIDGSNYQEVGGSYFGTNIPAAFSPDGRYLALLTTAPNNYSACEGNGDCDAAAGQHCGEEKRCTVREVTIRLFDLEALDELPNGDAEGKTCTSDDECSPAHECDIPSDFQLDRARCIPRRVVLGLPNTPKQPRVGATSQEGCDLTAGNDSLVYTNAYAPMRFGPDGNLYLVGARECAGRAGELNIGDTDILRISPLGGVIDVVSGNPGEDFDDGRCYDETEMKIDTTDCIIYIKEAMLSPEGNELAFLGTNPNNTEVAKVSDGLDVWTVLRNGDDREWLGQNGLYDNVVRMRVHPKN